MQKGTVGNFFVFGVLALLIVLGITAVGGLPADTSPTNGTVVNVITPTQGPTHSTLQLQTFGYVTIAPTPTLEPSESLCKPGGVNNEQTIFGGYSPATGQSVSQTGQIKIWVIDEWPPFIAKGQKVSSSGQVIAGTGNLTALAPDGYLWEPALYIAPNTVETGGSPHFPDYIKGTYNNNPPNFGPNYISQGTPFDTNPGNAYGTANAFNKYTAEYVWDVSKLGLASGTSPIEFVVHDGDDNRGVYCVSMQIQ